MCSTSTEYGNDEVDCPLLCRLCPKDETVPVANSFTVYDSKQHRDAHENSAYHGPYKVWQRRMEIAHDDQDDDDDQWYCPYHHNSARGYQSLEEMAEHVQNSTVASTSQEHEDGKRLDGWLDTDFSAVSKYRKDTWETEQIKTLKRLGVKIPGPKPKRTIQNLKYPWITSGPEPATSKLAPLPHGIRRGNEIVAEAAAGIEEEAHPGVLAMMAAGLIWRGDDPNQPPHSNEIPDRFKDMM